MLSALVWNAISFTSNGSVNIRSQWKAGWLLTVKDTGPGIPPDAIPHIFEPFWRGNVAGTAVPTAACGLGLAMAQAFAHLIKGQLSLKISSKRGSIFSIFVPDSV